MTSKNDELERLICFYELAVSLGADGSLKEYVPFEGKGKWITDVSINPIDDSTTVVLTLVADSGQSE